MSGRYWPYFLDTLRYPEIQHRGPLALLAEAEAGELDRLYESGLKLRDQFFPGLAENEAVIIHGQARGIPRHFLEKDSQFRTRVLNAWNWQNLAGRHWGLHKIFAEYGFPLISLTNLSGEYHWAEFDIEVEIPAGVPFDQDIFDLIDWIVFEYKRASAMPRSLRFLKRTLGKIHIAMTTLQGERHIVYPSSPELPVAAGPIKIKMAAMTHETWEVKPMPNIGKMTFARPHTVKLEIPLN